MLTEQQADLDLSDLPKQKKPHPGWANLRPAKKGEVRNPRGRPKKDLDLAALAQKHAKEAIETLVEVMMDKGATSSARVSAASEVLDRGYGKAPQHGSLNVEVGFSQQFEDLIRRIQSEDRQPRQLEAVDAEVIEADEPANP